MATPTPNRAGFFDQLRLRDTTNEHIIRPRAMGRRRKRPRQLEPIELRTTHLGPDGRAHAEHDGRTVLVAGALAGERVRVQLTGRARGRDEGRVLDVLEAAPERVEPGCVHFGTCGGCSLQHLDPVLALADKQARLLSELEAAGVSVGEVLPPLTGPTFGYRRRARLGIKWVERKGKVLVGFREVDKRFVADLSGCEILAGDAGRLIRPIGDLVERLALRERVPQVEVAVADDVVALVFRVLDAPGDDDLAHFREFEAAHRVRVFLQPGNLASVYPLDGADPRLHHRLTDFGLELAFLPTDFMQVNAALNQKMIALALELLDAGAGDRVLDLFCGLGNFTLPLAQRVHDVVGVEGEEGLVERARENARSNGIDNARFVRADLYTDPDAAPGAADVWSEPRDLVLLDPPRSGAEQVLASVARVEPRRIVYVSCGPASFVRDAARLGSEHGFDLVRVGVMDMFPHTTHVETIGVFEPRSGAKRSQTRADDDG